MIETDLTLKLNAEEHEVLNSALCTLLDAHYALYDYTQEDSVQVKALKVLREKSLTLWKERFD